MRSYLLFSFFLLINISFSQQTKNIVLHVNVLGKKHTTTRYYHPIEGTYEIELSGFSNTKAWHKVFSECVFIDPRLQLNDTLSNIQANSLRYYIDPAELLYIDWQWDSDTSNKKVLEEFKVSSKQDKLKYQKVVNEYFKPFYMKRGEVSNNEYREFVYWVRDSIFKEKLYFSDAFTDEEVFTLLNADYKSVYYSEEDLEWKSIDISDREENRKYFHFKPGYNLDKCFTDERTVPILYEFYLHPNERWYKRRELDVSKLKFRYFYLNKEKLDKDTTLDRNGNLESWQIRDYSKYIERIDCNVYPDTLVWVKDSPYFFNDPFSNMNFWHPAYGSYPVVGISWHQAKAFCYWKQQMLIAENPHLNKLIEVDLPTMFEYENAITEGRDFNQQIIIEDNDIITDLLIDNSEDKYGAFHELLLAELIPKTMPIYFTVDRSDDGSTRRYKKWLKLKFGIALDKDYEHHDFLYNFLLMRASQNYLDSYIRYLSNNVSEWMNEDYKSNYDELFKAYINYNCFASLDYCENQRIIDVNQNRKNPENGKLIMGANWFDERYEMILGVNTKGLYAKKFAVPEKAYSTVGFRYVIRIK